MRIFHNNIAIKRVTAYVLLLSQFLASCNHTSECPFKPEQKKWDSKKHEYTCPGGHHPRQESETVRLAREKANREQAAASSSRYQERMQHETEASSSTHLDSFERSQENFRRVEGEFEALHQEQAKRKQAEIKQMEKRNRAWKEQMAREKEQKLQKDKERAEKEEIKRKEREINRPYDEAWIRAGEEELEREKAAQRQERTRQEEETRQAIAESHREAEESWNKVWEARERAYEEQRKKKEKEQQLYEQYLPVVEERLKERARQAEAERLRLEQEEAEEQRRSEEESRKQQEAIRDEIHRSVEEYEKQAEWTRKQLQAELKLAQEATEALFKVETPTNPVLDSQAVDAMATPTSADALIRRNFLEKLGIADFVELDEDFKRKEEEEEERYMVNLRSKLGFNKHKTKKEVAEKNKKSAKKPAGEQKGDISEEDTFPTQPQATNQPGAEKQRESEKKTGNKSRKTTVTNKETIEKEKEKEKEPSSKEEDDRYKEENDEDSNAEDGEEDAQLTLDNAATEVNAYLEAVKAGALSPEEKKAVCMVFLTEVEALKKREKSLYRLCNELMIINSDFDSESLKMCKQEAQEHLEQLGPLRILRSQLQESCELTKEELIACNIKIQSSTRGNEGEYEVISSDEEAFSTDILPDMDLMPDINFGKFGEGILDGICAGTLNYPENFLDEMIGLAEKLIASITKKPRVHTLEDAIRLIQETIKFLRALTTYLASIKGNERERGEEIGAFIAEETINFLIIRYLRIPIGARRFDKIRKEVHALIEEVKKLEKLGKTVKGIKKVDKLEKQTLKKIKQTGRLERRAKRKINKAAKQQRQTNKSAKGQPEVQKAGKNKKGTKEWNGKYKKKKPGVSGKEGAKNPPEWAKEYLPREGESGKEFAKRIMDEKYGPDNYDPQKHPEFSKIKKWADRSFE